jgi:dienelactone hydrolase
VGLVSNVLGSRRALGWDVLRRHVISIPGVAGHVLVDPRVFGVLQAGPRVASFMASLMGGPLSEACDDVLVRPTIGLAAHAFVDELMIALFRHPELLPRSSDYEPAATELRHTHEFFSASGWLADPAAYHADPPPPDEVRGSQEFRGGLRYEHLTFASGWEPRPGEPGRDRWLSHEANRTVHAWMTRAGDSRSWLVCGPGFGMGTSPSVDLRAFRSHKALDHGINVVVPVLPLHGPRASGRVRGEDLMTINLVDSLHGVAQAAWDIRRLVGWLRVTQGAENIGLIGYSLGGLVVSIASCLEDGLACVVAGIPVVDLPALFRHHSPAHITRRAQEHQALGELADEVHRVASPLALPCRVPREHRYLFAGLGDRMSTFAQATRLWEHWDRPALATYAGGHVGFFWSNEVKRFVERALSESFPASADRAGTQPTSSSVTDA